MIFIETTIFTRLHKDYLTEDSYRELQNFLMESPGAGDVIQGAGGIRKIRWGYGNKGKRGGIRIIYYWRMRADHIYFLTLYTKNEVTDLTIDDKKILKQIVEELQ